MSAQEQLDKKIEKFYFINEKVAAQVVSVLILVIVVASQAHGVVAKKAGNCASFANQKQAQAAYNADPVKYKRLDGADKDKKVCEFTNYKDNKQ